MDPAARALAPLVTYVEEGGFGARGIHVRVGSYTARFDAVPDARVDVQSVAKGVCVIAAGIASDAGLFDVDRPVAEYLPGMPLGSGASEVTARHLLNMTSGVDLPWSPTLMTDWPDLAAEFLSRPTEGRAFQYSNASTYTAMRALGAVVGDVGAFVQARLFDPIGIPSVEWERCPNGHIVAGGGLHLSLTELARLGLLIRDEGEALVSPGWIRALHEPWFVREESADPYRRYALAGWGGPGDAWRLHGAYGQMLIFSGDAVVAITAEDHFGADQMAERVVEALAGA